MKSIHLFLIMLCMIVFMIGCSDKIDKNLEGNEAYITTLEATNDNLRDSLNAMELESNYDKEEAAYYLEIITELIEVYSETELEEFAENLWQYELAVNGVNIPKDGIVEVQDEQVKVSITETQPMYDALLSKMINQGGIEGDLQDNLFGFNLEPTETSGTDGTIVTATHYVYSDIEEDTIIKFSITTDLKQRLELDTTEIIINYQKQ